MAEVLWELKRIAWNQAAYQRKRTNKEAGARAKKRRTEQGIREPLSPCHGVPRSAPFNRRSFCAWSKKVRPVVRDR